MTTTDPSAQASRPATPAGRDAAALLPANRLADSRRKIRPPFALDPSMCFYSPQSNVDALTHPRVSEWLAFIQHEWTPTPVAGARGRLALLMPCTKYKPYFTSREHRSINTALLGAGWRPAHPFDGPDQLLDVLSNGDVLSDGGAAGDNTDLLATAPLVRDGVVLDRFVLSEPLALVPYEHTMYFRDQQSPATSYDDSGLFENRGTAVSPERADCTARQRADGSWRWGPNERQAYSTMHSAMADAIRTALTRLSPEYAAMLAWVSPGLTHRSFLAEAGPDLATVLPTPEQTRQAQDELAVRLAGQGRSATPGSVRAVYARGDGNDTPLGLPELTATLVGRIEAAVAAL